jgi:3-hydroxy acid dehydrogenase/malonic semialdehyde reductase
LYWTCADSTKTKEKLATLAKALTDFHRVKVIYRAVDVGDNKAVDEAVASVVAEAGDIDVLVNNVGHNAFVERCIWLNSDLYQAGLALGAPARFPELEISQIKTMNATNIDGMMFVSYSVLNRSMMKRKEGTILNITSVTGLEVPPFPGEAVYHANKACQEAFTNALRNIRILALRPGCVATNFHSQRVGHDKAKYDEFFEGFQ